MAEENMHWYCDGCGTPYVPNDNSGILDGFNFCSADCRQQLEFWAQPLADNDTWEEITYKTKDLFLKEEAKNKKLANQNQQIMLALARKGLECKLNDSPPPEPKGPFEIEVKTLTGQTFKLEVHATDTIFSLKQQIEKKRNGIPLEQQKLFYLGRRLEDARTLSEYNIKKKCTINLVLHIRGGPAQVWAVCVYSGLVFYTPSKKKQFFQIKNVCFFFLKAAMEEERFYKLTTTAMGERDVEHRVYPQRFDRQKLHGRESGRCCFQAHVEFGQGEAEVFCKQYWRQEDGHNRGRNKWPRL